MKNVKKKITTSADFLVRKKKSYNKKKNDWIEKKDL